MYFSALFFIKASQYFNKMANAFINFFKKKLMLRDDKTIIEILIMSCAELLGTAILLFVGCMGCVQGIAGGFLPAEQMAFSFGLAVLISVQIFAHISVAHINPVVTLAAVVLGKFPVTRVPIYVISQMLGALVGFACLKLVTPVKYLDNTYRRGTEVISLGVCSPFIHSEISLVQGFFVEFFITLILAMFCAGVWDFRNRDRLDSVAVRFGLLIAVLAMSAGSYTGAQMNPARSFAPALINGNWEHHWVFWVAPLSAGFLGALVYRILFAQEPKREFIDTGAEA